MRLYGIDYNQYATGGIGNQKLMLMGNKTLLFYTESEMLNMLAELKKNYGAGEIEPFTTPIVKEKYVI